MRRIFLILLAFAISQSAFAQLPDFYKKVSRVTWVVKDLNQVTDGWRKLGMPQITDYGEIELADLEFRGRKSPGRIRLASARIGVVSLDWIEPLGGENAFTDFLARHGSGVFALVHRAPSEQALKDEVNRLSGLGVSVLQEGTVSADSGTIRYAYLDTEEKGKYILGFIHGDPETGNTGDASPGRVPLDEAIVQFAFVVRNPKPASEYWKQVGLPEIEVTHGTVRNRIHRGQPGQFDHNLGWQRHGTVTYEWCIPLKGPTVYEDHMEAHGEGFHHLAFSVEDIDQVVADWSKLGFVSIQSGGWGEEGKRGSGRFAYMDTDAIGGVTIELLWSFRAR